MEKRRYSATGEETREQFITKRIKSVELSGSWHFMDSSQESTSMTSYSRTTSCQSDVSIDGNRAVVVVPGNDVTDKPELERSDTVDMLSQSMALYEDSFHNSFETDDIDGNRSVLLKQLSSEILNVGPEEEPCNHSYDVCRVLTYVQQIPPEIRTDIASYLSTGNLEQVLLTHENIHYFYHVASHLNLKQLKDSCLKFCRVQNQRMILSKFEGCGCKDDIEMESKNGYHRSLSVTSNSDVTEPPQYYVVFSKENDKSKIKVMVIDMSERRNVYNHEVDKMRHFGNKFACCSCEVKGSPFVFVSGGEGSAHLMKKYDIILGKWDKCAKLIHGRSDHMMVTSRHGSIFVLGGAEVPCIEEYDMKTNKWHERASLATHVVSAVCIYYQKKIFVFGGRTVAGPVANAQCYDTETHKVTTLSDLPCPFEGGQVVQLNDLLYIATDQGHMICYNPADDTSYLCTEPPSRRKQFGMFVKYGRIYLVGGVLCNDEDLTKTIPQYRYNPEKDLWVEKYKLCQTFPVLSNCIVTYEKKCCVIPFNESF